MNIKVEYKKRRKLFNKEKIKKKLIEIFGTDYVSDKAIDVFAYSKDFSLIANKWILDNKIATQPDFIVWPKNIEQLSELLKYATKEGIPIIPFGEGSGVVGGALAIFGGIIVDMKFFDRILDINDKNLTATIQTGKNGMNIERELNYAGFTLGHIPQSIYCSSLGGYIAHKAAGQFSTKYGKIEDMIISLEAVLPTGEIINTREAPKTSVGPQLDKLLIGSEGTLAIITKATLRIWPKPETRSLASFAFSTMKDALNSTRVILRNQAYPAVIRIYDREETERHFPEEKNAKNKCMTIFVCEGSKAVVNAEKTVINRICKENNGINCGEGPVHHWFETRFDVTETSKYTPLGLIMDTIEVSVMWDKALNLYNEAIDAMRNVEGTVIATGHASHFYPQGVCFYFSFGGTPGKKTDKDYWMAVWDACIQATLDCGGSISHHHGIGLNRTHWMDKEWDNSFSLLQKIKRIIDPKNILNPGKLYLFDKGE